MLKIEQQLEFFQYENKQMGDFLQSLGLTPDEITSYIINGDQESKDNMRMAIVEYLCLT